MFPSDCLVVGLIPGQVIPKTVQMVAIASLLSPQYFQVDLGGVGSPNDSRVPLLPAAPSEDESNAEDKCLILQDGDHHCDLSF